MATEIAPPKLDTPDARKRRHGAGALWRAGAWGGAAVIALAALAVTTQTESGSERLQLAFAAESPPPAAAAPVPQAATEQSAETKRLESLVFALAADREALTTRIASLERHIDDMTGSIKRQASVATDTQTAAAPAQVMPAAPATSPPAPTEASASQVSTPPAPAAETAPPGKAAPPAEAAVPAAIPLPPTRLAAVTPSAPPAEPPRKPEIGIDLGGARNLDVLNARWMAVKANFGPLLGGLHALAARDPRPGITNYRLLIGPLPTHAAAAQLCARFAAVRVTCRSAKFDGEEMAQR
jgi:hypothetical protein